MYKNINVVEGQKCAVGHALRMMNVDKEMLLKRCNEYAELFHGKRDETPTMRKT